MNTNLRTKTAAIAGILAVAAIAGVSIPSAATANGDVTISHEAGKGRP